MTFKKRVLRLYRHHHPGTTDRGAQAWFVRVMRENGHTETQQAVSWWWQGNSEPPEAVDRLLDGMELSVAAELKRRAREFAR